MSSLTVFGRPCEIVCTAHIRDSNNVTHAIRNLHVVVHDMNAVQPPATLLSQKTLNEAVSEALPHYTSGADLLPKNIISVGNHDLQLNGTLSVCVCVCVFCYITLMIAQPI